MNLRDRKGQLAVLFLIIGSLIFVVYGCIKQNRVQNAHAHDFKQVYAGALCLLHECNPYDSDQIRAEYLKARGDTIDLSSFKPNNNIYPPPSLLVAVPFALFDWPTAHRLWIALICISLVTAGFLAADLAAPFSPLLIPACIALFLSTSTGVIMLGQPGAVSIALCVIATWCFLKHRYVTAAIFCLAVSLILKPTAPPFVWLYFWLSGTYRRQANWTLAITAALVVLSIVWVSFDPQGANWWHELQTNVAAMGVPGQMNDPSPANWQAYALVNLQTLSSVFVSSIPAYNVMALAIFAIIFAFWLYLVLRTPASVTKDYFLLAATACISLLPVYHHSYDARLLLLTFPCTAMLLSAHRRDLTSVAALLFSLAITFMTPPGFMIFVAQKVSRRLPHLHGLGLLLLERPVGLLVLALGLFYLIVFWRRTQRSVLEPEMHTAQALKTRGASR